MWDQFKDTPSVSTDTGCALKSEGENHVAESPSSGQILQSSIEEEGDTAINSPETSRPVCVGSSPGFDYSQSNRNKLKAGHKHREQARPSPYLKSRPSALLISRFLEAVSHNNTEKVKEMIQQGMSPNTFETYFNRSALHIACSRGYRSVVRVLLENGANPNIRDKNQNTPLHLAASTESVEVVQMLLDFGTNVLLRDSNGLLALDFSIGKLRLSERIISKMQKLTESDIHKHREKTADICERIFVVFKHQLKSFELPPGFDPEKMEQMLNDFSEQLSRVRNRQIDFDSVVDQISNLQMRNEIDSDVDSLLCTLQQFSL